VQLTIRVQNANILFAILCPVTIHLCARVMVIAPVQMYVTVLLDTLDWLVCILFVIPYPVTTHQSVRVMEPVLVLIPVLVLLDGLDPCAS
jgi:hypothetical protein